MPLAPYLLIVLLFAVSVSLAMAASVGLVMEYKYILVPLAVIGLVTLFVWLGLNDEE